MLWTIGALPQALHSQNMPLFVRVPVLMLMFLRLVLIPMPVRAWAQPQAAAAVAATLLLNTVRKKHRWLEVRKY